MAQNYYNGYEDFKKIVSEQGLYIDKTGFIKQIFPSSDSALSKGDDQVILFTRPRRFGKTLTMSMLQNFLELNY